MSWKEISRQGRPEEPRQVEEINCYGKTDRSGIELEPVKSDGNLDEQRLARTSPKPEFVFFHHLRRTKSLIPLHDQAGR